MATDNKASTHPRLVSKAVCDGTMVTVEVSPDRTKYRIHKELITHHSVYFRNALNGSWKEAENGVVELLDVEKSTFNVFVHWLYTKTLSEAEEDWYIGTSIEEKSRSYVTSCLEMLKLLAFSDRFQVLVLKDLVHNEFVDCVYNLGCAPHLEMVIYAFENLPGDTPLLQFLADCHCQYWRARLNNNPEGLALLSQLPHDFLLRAVVRYGSERWAKRVDICSYHLHATEKGKKCPDLPRKLP